MSDLIYKNQNRYRPQCWPQTGFSPYVGCEIGYSENSFWESYAQVKQSLGINNGLDGFDDYRRFIDRLRACTDLKLMPLKDLISSSNTSKRAVALRFDVDMEPLAAIRLARYNARYGIPATFFLLHTAYYYGVLRDKVFYRNPLLKYWIKAFIISGCEIGLHTDALNYYLNHEVDGAMAIVKEIAWLRSQGVQVSGTAAHNSYPAYNAENFEIFADRALWGRSEAVFDSKRYPLGVLDEVKLNLTYEANYPISSHKSKDKTTRTKIAKWCNSTNSESVETERWMRTYLLDNPCFERGFDTTVWHHGGNRWTIATKANRLFKSHWYWKVDSEQMFRVFERLPGGVRVVFLLHPVYFSRDTMHISPVERY